MISLDAAKRFDPIARGADGVAREHESAFIETPEHRIIFNDQDGGFASRREDHAIILVERLSVPNSGILTSDVPHAQQHLNQFLVVLEHYTFEKFDQGIDALIGIGTRIGWWLPKLHA